MPLITDGMQPLTRARARAIKDSKTLKKIPSQEGRKILSKKERRESLDSHRAREGRGALSQGGVAWH
jgi:hypothetical protein